MTSCCLHVFFLDMSKCLHSTFSVGLRYKLCLCDIGFCNYYSENAKNACWQNVIWNTSWCISSLSLVYPSVVRSKCLHWSVICADMGSWDTHAAKTCASAGVVGKYPVKAEKAVLFSDLLVLAFMNRSSAHFSTLKSALCVTLLWFIRKHRLHACSRDLYTSLNNNRNACSCLKHLFVILLIVIATFIWMIALFKDAVESKLGSF